MNGIGVKMYLDENPEEKIKIKKWNGMVKIYKDISTIDNSLIEFVYDLY